MQNKGHKRSPGDLASTGPASAQTVYWNLTAPELYEEIARRNEGVFSKEGALIVDTGEHTGRSPKDKAIVREASSEGDVWWGEVNKDGKLAKNQGRLGPLTFEAREYFLELILAVQDEINSAAWREGKPEVSLINDEELWRIRELIGAKTYPDGWDGTEMRGDEMTDKIHRDGTIQPWMFN